MVTKNVRVVGYLPPPYHEKLREYMEAQSLTESAAIVKIVKLFFDDSSPTKVSLVAQEKDDAIAELKTDMTELRQRLKVLEQAVVSGKQRPFAHSKTFQQQRPPIMLPPQNCADLAKRLGVSTGTILEAEQKGEAYFRDWSRRMDPTKRSWQKRDQLFYPSSD